MFVLLDYSECAISLENSVNTVYKLIFKFVIVEKENVVTVLICFYNFLFHLNN